MKIPGPEPRPDGGVGAIARAGGLHAYQLWLHAEFGPVARFQLPGAGTAVSIADPVLLEATAHLDERPERLFSFLDPLFEAGNLQVLPAAEHTPWRRLLLTVLAGRPSHERHFARFAALATGLADRWAALPSGGPVELQRELRPAAPGWPGSRSAWARAAARGPDWPPSRRCCCWPSCSSASASGPCPATRWSRSSGSSSGPPTTSACW